MNFVQIPVYRGNGKMKVWMYLQGPGKQMETCNEITHPLKLVGIRP